MATAYSQRFALLPTDVTIISGSPMYTLAGPPPGTINPAFGETYAQSPASLGDSVSFSAVLDAGTYHLLIDAVTGPFSGQCQLAIDGSNVGSVMDAFNKSQVPYRTMFSIPFTLASANRHLFTLTVTGQTTPAGSMGGFSFAWRRAVIVPTADSAG